MSRIEEVISQLEALSSKRLTVYLPSIQEIKNLEGELKVSLPEDYKLFLTQASNVFVNIKMPYTYEQLRYEVPEIREYLEIPDDLFPFCNENGDYYCLKGDGSVCFWSHRLGGITEETWDSFASWVKKVWIDKE